MDAGERWLAYLRAEGARPGTVGLRRYYLRKLAESVDLLTATTDDLVEWMNGHDWGPETRKSARSTLRGFYSWAVEEGLRLDDPTTRLRPVRVPPGKPRPTPELVLEEAMARASEPERCMLALAAWAGLRRNEIAELRLDDIGDGQVRIRGKGGRVRVVPLHPRVEHALRERVQALTSGGGGAGRPKSGSGFDWVFPSPARPGWHVSADYVYRRIVALTGGWSPHTLRHRFASAVYRGSHDIRATQELLGHSSVATTQRYVAVDEDELTRAIRSIA